MKELYSMGHYVYESPDGGRTVYAREIGRTERKLVGENLPVRNNQQDLFRSNLLDNQLWYDIRLAAQKNPALQEALERVKIIYELSKE